MVLSPHVSHNPNSIQGGYTGDYIGDYYRDIKEDTRSLDYGSCHEDFGHQRLVHVLCLRMQTLRSVQQHLERHMPDAVSVS